MCFMGFLLEYLLAQVWKDFFLILFCTSFKGFFLNLLHAWLSNNFFWIFWSQKYFVLNVSCAQVFNHMLSLHILFLYKFTDTIFKGIFWTFAFASFDGFLFESFVAQFSKFFYSNLLLPKLSEDFFMNLLIVKVSKDFF